MPAERGRPLQPDQAPVDRVAALVEERVEGLARRLQRVGGGGRGGDRRDRPGLLRVQHGLEQGLLAVEVVVHRAAGDLAGGRDVLQRSSGVPARAEQPGGLPEQRRPGGLGVQLPPTPDLLHALSVVTYTEYVRSAVYVSSGAAVMSQTMPPPVYDPFAPGFTDDPYPQYAALRAGAPAGRHPLGFWLLTRYEDVSALLRANMSVEDSNVTDRELIELREQMFGPEDEQARARNRSMLDRDPPDHTRLRRLV